MKLKVIRRASEIQRKEPNIYYISPFVGKEQLALMLSWNVKTTNDNVNKFQKYIMQGYYPEESILRYSQSSYVVAIRPFLHFFHNYKHMKKGVEVEEYTPNFASKVWF